VYKNTRDTYNEIIEFKRVYRYRSRIVKDENGDLLAVSHNILNMWKKYLSQLSNVPRVSDVRQMEIFTDGLLVHDPSSFGFEIAIAKL
jgi:hypothetical protein